MRLTMFLALNENTPLEALWFEEREDDLQWRHTGSKGGRKGKKLPEVGEGTVHIRLSP